MSGSPSPGQYDENSSQTEAPSTTERARKRRRTTSTRHTKNQEIGLMRDGGGPDRPSFVGSGSGIYFVRTVYDILARSSGAATGAQCHLVPGEDDQLVDTHEPRLGSVNPPGAKACAPFWRADEVVPSGSSEAPKITFEALVRWTKSYFEIWHPAFPILHGPEALEILEHVANNGIESLSSPDSATVRAMVSISLADARQTTCIRGPEASALGPVPSDLVFHNLDHVAACLLFVLGTPASLKNMQASLCVELFLVTMLKLNMASRLGGVVVRMAYHLGLHRCPQRYSNFSSHEVSMRKRIWWSFYCLERLVCQALGLPLDVQDDDADVCFPTAERHQTTTGGNAAYEAYPEAPHQLQLLTLLSKHAKIRGMILELRHKSVHVRQDSVERALHVQSRLTRWANEVHEIVTGEGTDDEDDAYESLGGPRGKYDGPISPFYRTLLLVLQHESTIALNRPLLAKKPPTSASQAALQACIGASRAILETVDDPHLTTKDDTLTIIAVWPLLTWAVWMSCFILTYAALEGVTSISSAQKYAKRSLCILKHLSKRGTIWPDSCSKAVEHLISALEKRKLKATAVSDDSRTQDPAAADDRVDWRDSAGQKTHKRTRPTRIADSTSISRPRPGTEPGDSPSFPSKAQPRDETPYHDAPTEPGTFDAENTLNSSFHVPESHDSSFDMSGQGQDWWDPLSALDFSNFAQSGSTEGFSFF